MAATYGRSVYAVTDLPLNKAVGIAWLLPQASGDKERHVVSACSQTLHGLWETASGRGLYGHRMATVWPSGHLHLLHHVVANAVCTFPNASSLFQASPVPSVNVVDPSVCAACMQIRVQLGAEGFPLYGDTMYANMAHSSSPKVGKPQ